MVPSELTRRVGMGELLVLLVCWKSGPYGVPDQQGDTTDYRTIEISAAWKRFTTFLVVNLSQAAEIFLMCLCSVPTCDLVLIESEERTRGETSSTARHTHCSCPFKENGRFSPSSWRWPWRPRPWSWWPPLPWS